MSNPVSNNFSIFIRLDEETVYDYFNHHDPAPLYKRQLGHEFERYIYNSILTSKRNAVIKYQVVCLEYSDKRFVEPITQAIRSHFNLKEQIKGEEFIKFKRRTFKLLAASLCIVLSFQAMLPYFIEGIDQRRTVDIDSKLNYSKIVAVSENDHQTGSFIVLNPVINNITVLNKTGKDGLFDYHLYTNAGQLISSGEVNMENNSGGLLPLSSSIAAGIYILDIQNKEIKFRQKVLVQK